MGTQGRRPGGGILALIAAVATAAALVALIVQATATEAPLVDQAETALWWLGAAVLAAALALAAWFLQFRGQASMRDQVAAAEREAVARAQEAAAREQEAATLREEVTKRDAEVSQLQREVVRRDGAINEREQKLEHAKDRAERWSRRDTREREDR